MKSIAKITAAAALLAAGFGIGLGTSSQAAPANGTDSITVCFANSQLSTGGGTMSDNGGFFTLLLPRFNTGSNTDGHGLVLVNRGHNQGSC